MGFEMDIVDELKRRYPTRCGMDHYVTQSTKEYFKNGR